MKFANSFGCVVVLLCMSQTPVLAGVVYVDQAAAYGGDGTSWSNAFKDLQAALSVAVSSDDIWVADGTYRPGALRTSTFRPEPAPP